MKARDIFYSNERNIYYQKNTISIFMLSSIKETFNLKMYIMKLLISLLSLLFMLNSLTVFSQGISDKKMILKGKINGAFNGTKVYLLIKNNLDLSKTVDSTVIKNQKFIFIKNIFEPSEAVIIMGSFKNLSVANNHRLFFTDFGKIHFIANQNQLHSAEVNSKENTVYNIYNESVNYIERIVKPEFKMELGILESRDKIEQNILFSRKNDSLNKIINALKLDFAIKYPNSYKSPEILIGAINHKKISVDDAKTIFSNFTPVIKASFIGRAAQELLENAKPIIVGSEVPSIMGLDVITRKEVKIEDFRGKYLLINFWASWCGSCKIDHKNLTNIYKIYHNKGLEILGISLDTDTEHLAMALKRDNVEWTNISDYKGWKSYYAQIFNIGALPSNFLIDPNGKIINSGFKWGSLDKTIQSLFIDKN